MNRELIVNVNPTEISIALCEDKVLVELNKEQCQTGFAVGDIYLGKVRKIMPGLNAAFVNIGHEKDAFIHYLDLGGQFPSLQKLVASQQPGKRGLRVESMKLEPPVEKSGKIGDYLQVGQNIMVQIAKEAISTKGPRLTADISLAGRNVVLVPFSSKVFLSQKIRSVDEKKRLKRIAAAVLPKNFGVIIRTAAMEAKDEDIEHDIQTQIDRWRKTCAAIKKNTAPAQLMSEMNRANTIIRDSLNGSFSQIAVDDEAMYNDIRGYIRQIEPEKEKIVKLYRGNVPIFDNFDISKQIKSLFAKYVSLRRGAYLIIEHTEAMNVIDVNSGNRTKAEDNQEQTAMDVNLAAAAEIARQLRLRDLGGIVIIDFIDLHKAQNRQALYDEMVKLMATDKAKHTADADHPPAGASRGRGGGFGRLPDLQRIGQDRTDGAAGQEDREPDFVPYAGPRSQIYQAGRKPLCGLLPQAGPLVAAPPLAVEIQGAAACRRRPESRYRRGPLPRPQGQRPDKQVTV